MAGGRRAGHRESTSQLQRARRETVDLLATVERLRRERDALRGAGRATDEEGLTLATRSALRLSEARYRSLVDATASVVWSADRAGSYLSGNQSWQDYTGQPWPAQQGWGWLDMLHPADRPHVAALWQPGSSGAETRELPVRLWHAASGTYRHAVLRAVPIADALGLVQEWVGTYTDVHDAQRADDAMRLLAEAGAALSASLDLDETLRRVARLALPSLADWCQIDLAVDDAEGPEGVGYRTVASAHADPERERMQRALRAAYPPDPRNVYGIWHVLRTGESVLVRGAQEMGEIQAREARDVAHLHTLRQVGTCALMRVPLPGRDRPLGVLSFGLTRAYGVLDEVDLALAQELAARAAAALENARLYGAAREAIRARDEFLTVAAHELKTPITSMRGYAQLLQRILARGDTPDPSHVQGALDVFVGQSRKLALLVEQLLDVSRLEAGRLQLALERVDVVPLVRGAALGLVAGAVAGDERRLTVEAPDSLVWNVDPIRLEQVVTNLVANALRYTPPGSPIEVEVGASHDADGERLRVTVRDHGPGVSEAEREGIFQRFHRAHDDASSGGMGLGLFISRQIVELHGGTLTVEAPPRGGARFVLTLPAS
ncbi:MAG TPA: PAS domain-containing sensor histidine kinase [Chloroflexota bacterium]|nr:PAS domain-containing sensor histidine kinase [Chloroflexota bacterium]